jgi:hypothetical protein
MQNYFIRPGGAYIKIDSETKLVDLILNTDTQKTVSNMNDIKYYDTTVSASAEWPTTDQTTFDTNRNEVLNYLTGSI